MVAGDVVWQTDLDGSAVNGGVCIFLEDDIFVVTANQRLHHLDSKGNVLWDADAGSGGSGANAGGVLTGEGTYITGTPEQSVRAFDFETGNIVWDTSVNADAEDSAPALNADQSGFYIGTNDAVYKFDLDGNTTGSYDADDLGHDSSPAIFEGSDGLVLPTGNSSDEGGGVRSFSPESDGNTPVLEWETGSGSRPLCHPAIDQNNNLYATFPANGQVSKIDWNGSVIWNGSLPYSGNHVGYSVALDDPADRVYVTSYDDDLGEIGLTAFTQSGSKVWEKIDSTSPFVVESGATTTPAIQWVPAVMADSSIIVPWEDDLKKFDSDGNLVWEAGLGTWIRGAPAATAIGGYVVAGGQNGTLYAVETNTEPRYSLADANARPWDFSKFRHNSGKFTNSTVLLSDGLGVRGTGAGTGDEVILYSDAVGVGDSQHAAGEDTVLSELELGQ